MEKESRETDEGIMVAGKERQSQHERPDNLRLCLVFVWPHSVARQPRIRRAHPDALRHPRVRQPR